jgi:hypothetical protein
MGTQYKENCNVLLPENTLSTISIGQSCYVFFSPAVRDYTNLRPLPSTDGEEPDSYRKGGAMTTARRFPKIWSKAIAEVFSSLGSYEISQSALMEQFKAIHSHAVSSFFCDSNDVDGELWVYLKRFVSKSPFDHTEDFGVIRFDPLSVKTKIPTAPKRAKISDGEELISVLDNEAISID